MNRAPFAALAFLSSTGLASAADLVPGSDLGIRQVQAAADQSVVDGVRLTRAETVFGYPADDAARADDRGPATRAGAPLPADAANGILVPGSDRF